MAPRSWLLLGSTALLFTGSAAAPAFSDEYGATQRLNRQQLEYRVVPRPSPHRVVWVQRWVWDDFWGDYHLQWVPRYSSYRNVSYTRSSHRTRMASAVSSGEDSAQQKSDQTAGETPKTAKDVKSASIDTQKTSADMAGKSVAPSTSDPGKPLTPAEIRGAIPLAKVADPKQTLASTPIKSVWGDTLGKVRDVDVSGNNVKMVEAVIGGKGAVKIDASRLKYVRSRNLIVTTLSKADAAKLPQADRS